MSDTKDLALSISTAAPKRKRISIDDAEYELATTDDLELKESLVLGQAGKRVQKCMQGEISDAGVEEIQTLLDQVVRRVVIALPEEVFAKLRSVHKVAIMEAFNEAARPGEASQQTPTSPPDSSDSTADPPASG